MSRRGRELIISWKSDPETLEWLNKTSRRTRVPRSEYVREAIRRYVRDVNNGSPYFERDPE